MCNNNCYQKNMFSQKGIDKIKEMSILPPPPRIFKKWRFYAKIYSLQKTADTLIPSIYFDAAEFGSADGRKRTG